MTIRLVVEAVHSHIEKVQSYPMAQFDLWLQSTLRCAQESNRLSFNTIPEFITLPQAKPRASHN